MAKENSDQRRAGSTERLKITLFGRLCNAVRSVGHPNSRLNAKFGRVSLIFFLAPPWADLPCIIHARQGLPIHAPPLKIHFPDLVKLTPLMAAVTAVLFKNLQDERSGLVQMIMTLNTVQKKGKGNINTMDVEAEGVED
ncbi:hypothetical protein GGX14DRAFT_404336 [Mycena pura]|uniref:Uncharacterized protein n=1 Tax=Mycena pura TaxID=153505 RepID=A0AAD6Y7M8_9AGAR|nr:hypothetical protein GGX14DRAFT_404336 [Mycena pura]